MLSKRNVLTAVIALAIFSIGAVMWLAQPSSNPVVEKTQAPRSEIINATLREFNDQSELIWEVEQNGATIAKIAACRCSWH
jgi:hypothetical protein